MDDNNAECANVCDGDVLGEELHGDPDAGVHEALDQPRVDIQVGDETDEPDDHEGRPQHHLLPELLQRGTVKRKLSVEGHVVFTTIVINTIHLRSHSFLSDCGASMSQRC